jgi:stage V sporulation protein AD
MAESLLLGSVLIDGGGGDYVLCATGSHFCSAEKQFRTPLEYGGQRTPTSQWTVTGSGAAVLSRKECPIKIDCATVGRVVDWGIKDANNMGGAMAPAFVDTLNRHFKATNRPLDYYDLILSGDLGHTGKSIANELFHKQKMDISRYFEDCGVLIFDKETQDTHSGGSGCGCSASVLCGYILPEMLKGKYRRILFAATGALMSPTLTMQSETIPSISHAISITIE